MIVEVSAPSPTSTTIDGQRCDVTEWERTTIKPGPESQMQSIEARQQPDYGQGYDRSKSLPKLSVAVRAANDGCLAFEVSREISCRCHTNFSSVPDANVRAHGRPNYFDDERWNGCSCPPELAAIKPVKGMPIIVLGEISPSVASDDRGRALLCPDQVASKAARTRRGVLAAWVTQPIEPHSTIEEGRITVFVDVSQAHLQHDQGGQRRMVPLPAGSLEPFQAAIRWSEIEQDENLAAARGFVKKYTGTPAAAKAAQWFAARRAERMKTQLAGSDDAALYWMENYLKDFGAADTVGTTILERYGAVIVERAAAELKASNFDAATDMVTRAISRKRVFEGAPTVYESVVAVQERIDDQRAASEAAAARKERQSASRSSGSRTPAKLGRWSRWEESDGMLCRYRMGEQADTIALGSECRSQDKNVLGCSAATLCTRSGNQLDCKPPQNLTGSAATCVSVVQTVIDAVLK